MRAIVNCQAEIDALHAEIFRVRRESAQKHLTLQFEETMRQQADASNDILQQQTPATLTDAQVLQLASNARNGEKFCRLQAGDQTGYDSPSEADQAFCAIVAFYAQGDPAQIDRMFRASGLMRDKWEREGYRRDTISNAVALCNGKFYTPKQRTKVASITIASASKVIEDIADPHRLARICLRILPILRFWREEFYLWERPVYRRIEPAELKSLLTNIIKAEFDRANIAAQTEGAKPHAAKKVTRSLLNDVLGVLAGLTLVRFDLEQPAWIDIEAPYLAEDCLVATNGIINPGRLSEREPILFAPTARLFTTNGLDYAFDADTKCPMWVTFLNELWNDDPEQIRALQEWLGYLLLPDTSLQKMLMLIGPRRSGKGTIARVFRGVIGAHNCCAPTLASLSNEFGLQPLLGKTVAIVGDARVSGRSDSAVIVERLLSITGEDAQTVNRKHMSAVTTQLKTRFILISNELPKLDDASATLPSRIILLRMTRTFCGHEDSALTNRLVAERAGILNWALIGRRALYKRGHFLQPRSNQELLGDMEELSSPITAFVRDACEIGPGFQVSVEEIFGVWKSWCKDNERSVGSIQSFGRDLRAAVPSVRGAQPRVAGKQVRSYNGIRLKCFAEAH